MREAGLTVSELPKQRAPDSRAILRALLAYLDGKHNDASVIDTARQA